MAMLAGLLTSPLLLAVIALVIAGAIALFLTGALKTEKFESGYGLAALCAMKWQDFAGLVSAFLAERGLLRAPAERKPGDGGFDLLVERGTSSYLVICKNASGQSVNGQAVTDLQRSIQHHEAEGAVIATCGDATAEVTELARSRGIEVIAGGALWRQIKHLLPYDLRDDAEAAALRERRRRLSISVAIALVAAGATWVIASAASGASSDTPEIATRPAAPARAPTIAPAVLPAASPALPDPTLNETQLETRRATAAMEVRSIPSIGDAAWSTKSTLVISMPTGAAIPDTLVEDICRVLLQYEEQRFTRLQLETAAAEADKPPVVRWRQCR